MAGGRHRHFLHTHAKSALDLFGQGTLSSATSSAVCDTERTADAARSIPGSAPSVCTGRCLTWRLCEGSDEEKLEQARDGPRHACATKVAGVARRCSARLLPPSNTMSTKVGINGFGRIGRLAFRAACNRPEIEIVSASTNSRVASARPRTCSSTTRVQGRWTGTRWKQAEMASGSTAEPPSGVQRVRDSGRRALGSERATRIVLETTGKFSTCSRRSNSTLNGGVEEGRRRGTRQGPRRAQRRHGRQRSPLRPRRDIDILTAASCTTNCLAPVVKVVHEGIGIVHGSITTLHDATNTQMVVDAPHKDLRRARAAGLSLIPTSRPARPRPSA